MTKTNGTGGHHDDDEKGENDPKIAHFPTPSERLEMQRRKDEMEAARAKAAEGKSEPILNLPPACKALCGFLIAAHCAYYFSPESLQNTALENLAFIPAHYTGGMEFGLGGWLGPVTHMFLHGGWLHLGVNVATMMAFGAAIEKFLGWKKFLILFFATGIIGAATHFALFPHDGSPLVGASGGISGLFGAVMLMAQEQGMTEKKGFRALLPVIIIWVGINLFFGMFGMPGEKSAIAWTVHIGGFLAGIALYKPVAKLKL